MKAQFLPFSFFRLIGLPMWWGIALASPLAAAEPLVLVAAADSVPTSYVENGSQTGILIDVIEEAFRRAQYPVEIQLMPWARCQLQVKTGAVDGIFSIYRTAERQQFLVYTNEVLITQTQAFFVLSTSAIAFDGNLETMAHRTVGIINSTSYGPRLDVALKAGVFPKIEVLGDSEKNLRMLLAGRVDVIPSYRHVVLSTARGMGVLDRIKELSPSIEAIPSYLAFTNKREFSAVIGAYDRAIASMKKDGTYDRIFSRYLQ